MCRSAETPQPAVTILTGPTACGKSAVALALAPMMGAEIVAVDSMTLYRGLDIGTAKPTADERAAVPHHLINVCDPADTFNAAQFVEAAEAAVADIRSRGREPLLVGGTPMYLRALIEGLFEGPPANPALRREVRAMAETAAGRAELHARLAAVDPPTAERVHPNDVKRIERALEVHAATGRPISALQTQWADDAPARPHRMLILERDTADLRARIARRIDAMFAQGFLLEVERLLRGPRRLSRTARHAVGYAEAIDHLEKGVPLAETRERIRARTWKVARKQRTWLRRFTRATRVHIAPSDPPEKTAKVLYKRLGSWHNHGATDG